MSWFHVKSVNRKPIVGKKVRNVNFPLNESPWEPGGGVLCDVCSVEVWGWCGEGEVGGRGDRGVPVPQRAVLGAGEQVGWVQTVKLQFPHCRMEQRQDLVTRTPTPVYQDIVTRAPTPVCQETDTCLSGHCYQDTDTCLSGHVTRTLTPVYQDIDTCLSGQSLFCSNYPTQNAHTHTCRHRWLTTEKSN